MPYLGKQAVESGALISTYEFVQATDTASGTTSFGVVSGGGDYVRVFLNGVLLVEGASNDYTKTNSAVVLGTAPADGDILKVDVYSSMNVWDTLPASGGSVTGDLTVTGIITGKGILPLGAIIPIASGLTNAYTLPTTGTVDSNGFVLCDGASFHGDCTLTGNAPTLTDGRFLRGNTHGNTGGTGGADSVALAEANIPEHAHAYGNIAASAGNQSASHSHSSGGTGNETANHSHNHGVTNYGAGNFNTAGAWFTSHSDSNPTTTGGASHNHAGSGNTGNQSASHSHTITVSGSTANWGTASVTNVNTLPKYLHVVYLIRAK